jgi:hypothetical protein
MNMIRPPGWGRNSPDPHVQWLHGLAREAAEDFYLQAFAQQDRDTLRWLAFHDRYFLLTCVLNRPDARHDWLYERCREVEADPNDHIDLWAREHYKSTIITFAGIIQEIIRDPDITIGIFAHNRPAAKSFLRQIKEEMEANNLLKQLFPEIFWQDPARESPKWSLDDGIIVKRRSNPKEATVEAWGLVDGMPTGKHFRLLCYDDVVTEKSVGTPEMIAKTTEMFELSDNLGAIGGDVWIIGTRYHFADTYGHILKNGITRERRHAATRDGTFDGTPVFLTEDAWARKKARQSASIIASQQLLNPLAGSEAKFSLQWLKYWIVRPRRLTVYILCDPGKRETRRADNTAIAVIGVDVNRKKYLLDGWRHKMPMSRRWQIIRDQWRRYSRMAGVDLVMVGYEQYGLQSDLEYFEERMRTDQISFTITEVNWPRSGNHSKQDRIERLEPDFRMGQLLIPGCYRIDLEGNIEIVDCRQMSEARPALQSNEPSRIATPLKKKDEANRLYDVMDGFVEEYMFFPFAPRDDFLDALSRIYDMEFLPPVGGQESLGGYEADLPEVYADGV